MQWGTHLSDAAPGANDTFIGAAAAALADLGVAQVVSCKGEQSMPATSVVRNFEMLALGSAELSAGLWVGGAASAVESAAFVEGAAADAPGLSGLVFPV
jgi:hypothetical protein